MPAVMAPSPMTATTLRPSPSLLGRHRHAERRPDGGAGVAHAEHVVLALFPPGEGVQPSFMANGVNALPSSGQDLVGIGLVAYVPHQPIEGVL